MNPRHIRYSAWKYNNKEITINQDQAELSFRRVGGMSEPTVIGRRSAVTLNQDL